MNKIFRDYDRAALDAQYNNRAMVPNHGIVLADWAERSAEVRRRARAELDIPYGSGPRQRLDFFPAERRHAPIHMFIHGGYWRALDKASFSFPAPNFAAAGISYAPIAYPLAPAASMADIVSCVEQAFAWLVAHAEKLGGDPERISVSGHSAGGHLLAMLAAAQTGRGAKMTGGVAISGIYDLEPIRLSYLNDAINLDAESAQKYSPLRHASSGGPPLSLAVGARESAEFHRQQEDFGAAWRRAGNELRAALDLADHDHFSIVGDLAKSDSDLFTVVRGHALSS